MPRLPGTLLLAAIAWGLAANANCETPQERRLREGTALISVTRPDGTGGIGTGITVGTQGPTVYLATALHVIAGREETWDATRWEVAPDRIVIEVEFSQDPGRRYRGQMFQHWDRRGDLAVVVVRDDRLTPLGIGVSFGIGSPSVLQPPYSAIVIGHPDRKSWLAADARITEVRRDALVLGGSRLGPGFSGGAVLDARRQLLIGMLRTASLEGNQALPAPMLAERLREWQIPHGLRESKVSSPMVRIPAGRFVMGMRSGPSDAPERVVELDAFHIDKYEVTVSEFRRFVEDTGYFYTPGLPTCNFQQAGFEHHAMNCVTWNDASEFAKWAGKALPTEAQWEKAARGSNGLLWPWGNTPPRTGDAALGVRDFTVEPGRFPRDTSPYGVVDTLGNVSEWVADWYRSDYFMIMPDRNPEGPGSGEDRVIRGSSTSIGLDKANLVRRHRDLPRQGRQKLEYGFRCVLKAD